MDGISLDSLARPICCDLLRDKVTSIRLVDVWLHDKSEYPTRDRRAFALSSNILHVSIVQKAKIADTNLACTHDDTHVLA